MYEIVGYERNSGYSKKKQKDYDYEVLYCKGEALHGNGDGYKVYTVVIDRIKNPAEAGETPYVGAMVKVLYNRAGYAEGYSVR